MNAKPRVFVSSVVQGFAAFRQAARIGIKAARCEPILVNEDFPSLAMSSRNACLEGVASCDAVVVVVGGRGGWRAPSGKLVVEEEFEHARRRGLPTYVFVQETERDGDAEALCKTLGDYVRGNFRDLLPHPQERQEIRF